ncbi:phage antirepressor KilAC domain-containing protein [Mycobacterium sp. NPDC049093]
MSAGIPDPGGVSGTFAALERTSQVRGWGHDPEPLSFAFGDRICRAVVIDGDPWFVLSDICRAIEIGNVGNVADRLSRTGAGIRQTDIRSGGQMRMVTLVDESGMYEAVIRSDKPEAMKFRRWITSEVLPAIRKTGSYSRYPAQPEAAALPSKRELAQWVIEAEDRADRAESQVRALTPPASAWNELAEAAGDYSVSDAAKVLSRDPAIDIKERALFAFMAGLEWVFRRDRRWKAYRTQLDTGRLAEKVGKPFWHEGRGELVNGEPTVRITPKGLAELHKRLGGTGQLALVAAS